MTQKKPQAKAPLRCAQMIALAQQQLNTAIAFLTEPKLNVDIAIHETRRCLKRLRALLRLLQFILPHEIFARDNAYCRDAARQLSALRDAAVRREIFRQLKNDFIAEFSAVVWAELEQLFTPKHTTRPKRELMQTIATLLESFSAHMSDWECEIEDKSIVLTSLRKMYRKGKKRQIATLLFPNDESYHQWRKSVNHLR